MPPLNESDLCSMFSIALLKKLSFGLIVLTALWSTVTLSAETDDRKLISDFYEKGEFSTDSFSAYFLGQISPQQLSQAAKDLRAIGGPLKSVSGDKGAFSLKTDTHEIPVTISRDASGKVTGLLFKSPKRLSVDLSSLVDDLKKVPGEVSVLVTKDKNTLQQVRADEKLAVGSAFKLGILQALQNAIDTGKANWSDTIPFEEKHRSLPSGLLQKWPSGVPLTLHTTAALMISRSDNTATDMLMDYVGRDAVAKLTDIPVPLKTREFFVLKASPLEADAWRNGDTEDRLAQTKRLAIMPRPSVGAVLKPYERRLEWLMSTEKLCELIEGLGDHPLAAINVGLADKSQWDFVTYKGGSEIGVLNLTTRLVKDDSRYCISMTWNGPSDTSVQKLNQLYTEMIDQLAQIARAKK